MNPNAPFQNHLVVKTEVKSGDTEEDDPGGSADHRNKEYEEYQVSLKEDNSEDFHKEKQRKTTRKSSSVMVEYESALSNSSHNLSEDERLSESFECASPGASLVDILKDHRYESVSPASSRGQES
eukprot:Nitzschia sp. Nitz4//scaffold141_size107518//52037//52411//NITZ4_004278-RA/size107518-processed-gene-0.112-mRNA-1//-1//CDS//3329536294//8372//frame0